MRRVPRSPTLIDGSLIRGAYAAQRKEKLRSEFSSCRCHTIFNCPSPRSLLSVLRHTIGARTCPKDRNPGDREDQDGVRSRVNALKRMSDVLYCGGSCASALWRVNYVADVNETYLQNHQTIIPYVKILPVATDSPVPRASSTSLPCSDAQRCGQS
jgi:hypothetical protein